MSMYWRVARELSGGLISAAALFLLLVSVPLRKRIFGRRPRAILVLMGKKRMRLYVRDGADIATLFEVFVRCEYDVAAAKPERVADIGAHIGSASLYFSTRYPAARIYAYEPDPENFALLQLNTRDEANIECVNAAVTDISGPVTFYPSARSSIASSILQRAGSGKPITVRSVSIGDVLALRPDLVKFDTEGAEYRMFAAAADGSLASVAEYVGELHFDLMGATQEQFEALFTGFRASYTGLSANRAVAQLVRA